MIKSENGLLRSYVQLNVRERDLEIIPPTDFDLSAIDEAAARRTRSVLMFLGPLLHRAETFELPYAGGWSPSRMPWVSTKK
jgi:UDP-N-acetylglucosamine enolpyruvyl transferase